MSDLTHLVEQTLVCVRCEDELSSTALRCDTCGDALAEVRIAFRNESSDYKTRDVLKLFFRARRGEARASGVWRFRELVHASARLDEIVTRLEGNTRLYESKKVAEFAGFKRILLKHEGENPTGSFKDRGMTVGVTEALRQGARALACASTGNTSASLASYAAVAGVPAIVFIPEGKISSGKLAQTIAYGARVLQVRGNFDDAMNLVEEASAKLNLGLLNSINPWRVEGQKAIAFELLEELDWKVPDWIVLPAGNLGNISALGKACREAKACGLIDHLPRFAAVQAAGAAPFARFYEARKKDRDTRFVDEPKPETVATAIRIGAPRSWEKAIKVLDETNGVALSATDEQILEAKRAIDRAGIGCEPASAASVAGAKLLRASGVIAPDATVVAILTGHVLKDPENAVRGAPPPTVVDPTIDAIKRALDRA